MSILVRLGRYTGWLLLALSVLYALTALEYLGYFRLIGMGTASFVHSNLVLLGIFLGAVIVHCCSRVIVRLAKRKANTQVG